MIQPEGWRGGMAGGRARRRERPRRRAPPRGGAGGAPRGGSCAGWRGTRGCRRGCCRRASGAAARRAPTSPPPCRAARSGSPRACQRLPHAGGCRPLRFGRVPSCVSRRGVSCPAAHACRAACPHPDGLLSPRERCTPRCRRRSGRATRAARAGAGGMSGRRGAGRWRWRWRWQLGEWKAVEMVVEARAELVKVAVATLARPKSASTAWPVRARQ